MVPAHVELAGRRVIQGYFLVRSTGAMFGFQLLKEHTNEQKSTYKFK
jgi:hypothetical protein